MQLKYIMISIFAIFFTHTNFGMLVPLSQRSRDALERRQRRRIEDAKKQKFVIRIQNNSGMDIEYKTTKDCNGMVSNAVKNRETPQFGIVEFNSDTHEVVIKDLQNNPVENLCIEYNSWLYSTQDYSDQFSQLKNTIKTITTYNTQKNKTHFISGFLIRVNKPVISLTTDTTKKNIELDTFFQSLEMKKSGS